MQYQVSEANHQFFIELTPNVLCLQSEQDALDCVSACGENGTQRLMLYASNLSSDFYDLKTGLAGKILLKFSNYFLKVAAIIPPDLSNYGRFGEMAHETRFFNQEFRVFSNREEAEIWLTR